MSDQDPSLRGLKVKMEPEIVGESGDVKDEAKEMKMEDVENKEMGKIVTTTKDEKEKQKVR